MALEANKKDSIQVELYRESRTPRFKDFFSIEPVQHEIDFIKALKLVHKQYLQQGYCPEDPRGLFYGIHHLCPHFQTLNLKYKHNVIATVTKFEDSELFGLPMDALYRKELDPLRQSGRKIVECGSLASIAEKPFRNAAIYLQRAVIILCMESGMDDLCIAVNPRHASFYKRSYLFEELGAEKHYKMVNAPAVAMRLPLDRLREAMNHNGNGNGNVYTKLTFLRNKDFEYFLKSGKKVLSEGVFRPYNRMIQRMLALKPEIVQSLSSRQRDYFTQLGVALPKP